MRILPPNRQPRCRRVGTLVLQVERGAIEVSVFSVVTTSAGIAQLERNCHFQTNPQRPEQRFGKGDRSGLFLFIELRGYSAADTFSAGALQCSFGLCSIGENVGWWLSSVTTLDCMPTLQVDRGLQLELITLRPCTRRPIP